MNLSDRETATVLAALRYWQRSTSEKARTQFIHFEDHEPMNDEEIDSLCERINLGETEG